MLAGDCVALPQPWKMLCLVLSAHLYEYHPPRLLSEMLPTRALRLAITAGRSLEIANGCQSVLCYKDKCEPA